MELIYSFFKLCYTCSKYFEKFCIVEIMSVHHNINKYKINEQ